jgi:hypothetical protein
MISIFATFTVFSSKTNVVIKIDPHTLDRDREGIFVVLYIVIKAYLH